MSNRWNKKYHNEDDCPGGIEVKYKRNIYITGNRRHDYVELGKISPALGYVYWYLVPIKKIRGNNVG